MSIPTELVGSLPRPMKLQQAYADHDEDSFERGLQKLIKVLRK